MKFVDEAQITVQSGDGGNGCLSFRREKYVPKGGPDGGDGGKGGDIVFQATSRMHTLHSFQFKQHHRAQRGAHGRGKNKSGKAGKDLIVLAPAGTLLRDVKTGRILKDLIHDGECFVAASGGRGGLGNKHFASPSNPVSRYAQKGEPGQSLSLRLELKLQADIGIIGLPNAGKSTLMSKLSSARPRIADYPFTTLTPTLGVIESERTDPFVIVDMPSLIEGAHRGVGLGTRFLKHLEGTRFLLHVIDLSALASQDAVAPYEAVNRELELFSPDLGQKSQVVVLNKVDKPEARALAGQVRRSLEPLNADIRVISALTGEGLEPLKSHLAELVEEAG